MVVFIDGCFWHCCPKHGTLPKSNREWWTVKLDANVARDRETDLLLRDSGWEVVRVWEHTPLDQGMESILQALESKTRTDPSRLCPERLEIRPPREKAIEAKIRRSSRLGVP